VECQDKTPVDYQYTLFLKNERLEGKTDLFLGMRTSRRGEGIRKRVDEGKYSRYILYSYMKIEK
jgi:hypothetical protein